MPSCGFVTRSIFIHCAESNCQISCTALHSDGLCSAAAHAAVGCSSKLHTSLSTHAKALTLLTAVRAASQLAICFVRPSRVPYAAGAAWLPAVGHAAGVLQRLPGAAEGLLCARLHTSAPSRNSSSCIPIPSVHVEGDLLAQRSAAPSTLLQRERLAIRFTPPHSCCRWCPCLASAAAWASSWAA